MVPRVRREDNSEPQILFYVLCIIVHFQAGLSEYVLTLANLVRVTCLGIRYSYSYYIYVVKPFYHKYSLINI